MARALSYKWWLLLGLALLVGATLVGRALQAPPVSVHAEGTPRIVSLSPALTETLFAIGAGAQVVGVSDYCSVSEARATRRKVGTSITPNYETIVSLSPTLIVTEAVVNARPQNLERLARTVALPWLELDQVLNGTRRLGELTGKVAEANELAERLARRLSVEPPPSAPRVLLVLGYGGDKLDEVWFIRRNSIHGAALRAAGGKNAVERDIAGQPRLSLERVLALDPDVILVLLSDTGPSAKVVLQNWRKLEPLTAVKRGRLAAIVAPEAFMNGPSILRLSERIEAELKALSKS